MLLQGASFEFKALFTIVHADLKARNAASGGEEMLRLRSYEKLQNLVQAGVVQKVGREYKGVKKALTTLMENLALPKTNGPAMNGKPTAPLAGAAA